MSFTKIFLWLLVGSALGGGAGWLLMKCFPTHTDFSIESSAVSPEGILQKDFLCTGSAGAPSFDFFNIPLNAKSLAVVAYRPSLLPKDPSLWIAYDFPTRNNHIPEGLLGGKLGVNLQGNTTIIRPCPKSGESAKYAIAAYALKEEHPFAQTPTYAMFMEYVTKESIAVASLAFTAQGPQ